jgi:hypothetical protein
MRVIRKGSFSKFFKGSKSNRSIREIVPNPNGIVHRIWPHIQTSLLRPMKSIME